MMGANGMLAMLADAAVKGTALLTMAAVAAAVVLRRSSAANRHRVWAASLVGLLALPALSLVLPGLSVLPRWVPTRGGSDGAMAVHIPAAEPAPPPGGDIEVP